MYRVMYLTPKGVEKISKSMSYHEARKFANKKKHYCEILEINDMGIGEF
jgi:hypothetical protein